MCGSRARSRAPTGSATRVEADRARVGHVRPRSAASTHDYRKAERHRFETDVPARLPVTREYEDVGPAIELVDGASRYGSMKGDPVAHPKFFGQSGARRPVVPVADNVEMKVEIVEFGDCPDHIAQTLRADGAADMQQSHGWRNSGPVDRCRHRVDSRLTQQL